MNDCKASKATPDELLEASVMSQHEPKSEKLWWAKRRIEELLKYICEIRSEHKIARMTCPNCNIGKIHLMIHDMCRECIDSQFVTGKKLEDFKYKCVYCNKPLPYEGTCSVCGHREDMSLGKLGEPL